MLLYLLPQYQKYFTACFLQVLQEHMLYVNTFSLATTSKINLIMTQGFKINISAASLDQIKKETFNILSLSNFT